MDNLDFVLKFVEELFEGTIGKFVITADHGNLVGERQGRVPTPQMSCHPGGLYAPALVPVPCFPPDVSGRIHTLSEPPKTVF